jgi:hypothetical protein
MPGTDLVCCGHGESREIPPGKLDLLPYGSTQTHGMFELSEPRGSGGFPQEKKLREK